MALFIPLDENPVHEKMHKTAPRSHGAVRSRHPNASQRHACTFGNKPHLVPTSPPTTGGVEQRAFWGAQRVFMSINDRLLEKVYGACPKLKGKRGRAHLNLQLGRRSAATAHTAKNPVRRTGEPVVTVCSLSS